MANFEGLIRQALASQNASDPAVRERIYQSSRNALARMLEKSGNTGDDIVRLQFGRLEQSIAAIEGEFAPPLPETELVPETQFEPAPEPIPEPEPEPAPEPGPEPGPEPNPEPAYHEPRQTGPLAPSPQEAVQENTQQTVIDPEQVFESILQPQEIPQPDSIGDEPRTAPEAGNVPDNQASAPPSTAEVPSTGLPPDYTPAPLFPPVDQSQPVVRERLQPTDIPHGAASQPTEPVRDLPREQTPVEAPVEAPVSDQAPVADRTPLADNERVPEPSQLPDPAHQEFSVGPESAPATTPHPDHRNDAAGGGAEPDFGSAESPRLSETVEPYLGDVTAPFEADTQYQQPSADEFAAERDLPPTYKRKHPLLRRIWPIFLAIAVLLVILWIMYALLATRDSSVSNTGQAANGEATTSEDGSTIITLLQPTDLSALVTAGRGSAELITEQKRQMLRIRSIRQDSSTAGNAEPILLELERGVLRQINGKEVTVEFYAKSGENGPAQFAIQCDIGGDSVCGRKRFRVGLQPERILFSLDLKDGFSTDERAFLAINTDITNAAETTGSGDEIDIIHVRLRLSEPQN